MSEGSPATSARDASIGGALRLAAELVIRVSSIVATLWLTRSLGVTSFGALLLALSEGLVIAELCDLGLNATMVPLIVRCPRNLGTVLRIKAALTLAVLSVGAAFLPFSSRVSGVEPALLALTTLHFVGATWIEISGAALRALGHPIGEAALLFVFRFSLVALVVSSPFGMTVAGACEAYALAVLPAAVFAGMGLVRHRPRDVVEGGATGREILRQALPMGANGYLAIISTRVELFLLKVAYGENVVGLFGGALRIVESLLTLPAAIAAGALPSVARDAMRGTRGAAQRMFGLVVWIGVPAAFGLALCAPEVLRVLGPGFVEGALALRILSFALLLCFANAALFHLLIAAGETPLIPKLTGARVIVAAIAGLALIPFLGSTGAAVSFTLSELSLFALLVQKTRPHAAIDVLRPVAAAIAACIPMIALLFFAGLPLASKIVFGALLFVAAGALILRRGTAIGGLA
jgi:O-antigen/teichoic acid export membrane protein